MSQKKFLDYTGLQNFFNKLKGIIPTKTSELQNDSGFISEDSYDSALSLESEKAVQNKVVTAAINSKQDTLNTAQTNAVDSGITSSKVQGYDSHISDTGIHVTQADKTSWDSKAPGTHTHLASDVSGLSTVATSGSYNDLSNKPSIPSKTSDLTNDSGFLTSHNPIDSTLSKTSTNAVQNKVVKNALDGKSDTGHTHTKSEITDFPTLATVATSGSYNDLSNTPTIPTVNNATLTIQKNGTTVNTFTANSSSNVTANITVPVNVSELTNDSGYLTSASNLDSSKLTGTIDIARLPKGALERLVTVADQTARFALTENDVQLGDTVKQLDTGVMYIVTDESKLSSADGYTEYTAGSATSVPWSGVQNKPSTFTPASHTHGSITNDGKLGTASRALVTDSSKKIAVSSVTSTELGYLSGVTSAIQTQLNGKSDTGHTHTSSEVSGLATVATSGSYNDLSNKPSIPSKTSDLTNDSGFLTSHNPIDIALSSTSTNAVQNKVINNALSGKSDTGHTHLASEVSGLSTVATSGSYSDLTNKPTIDSALSSTSTNALQNKVIYTELGKKANTTDLATVATSGNYADLTNKPSIPTKTSDLTNDSGFLTSHNPVDSTLSSTSTNAVQNKVVKTALDGKANSAHTHTKSEITDFPTLSTVATSGSYNDLSNKPTIPTVYNKTLTIQQNGTSVATFTANSNKDVSANIVVPTKVSDLTNDSGYLTTHQSLADYSTKADTIKDLSISGKVITYTKGDDTTGTLTTQDTVYTHPTSAGNKHIPSGGSANQYLKYSASGTAQWATIKTSELNNDSGFLTSHNPVDSALSTTSENAVQNKVVKAELDNKANSADLSTVATTGSYTDLNNIPSNFTPASHTHGSITNDGKLGTASRALITDGNKKIAVSSVTSTELGYLSGVTSAVQDQLDGKASSTHSHTASEVSGLATVATSGSYNDLANKPTIPTVNNATLTIQKNGTTVKTFTANASANVTANITVPTKVSELTNDSGFLTSHNPVDSALSGTSTNAVQNKVVKGALDGKSDTGHTHTASEVSGLSTVATSGSYNDLSNKPTIPTVNNATLTIQKNGTTVKTFTANASSNVTANITVPTKVSELTNDSGFLTSASSLDSSKLTGTIDIARLPKGALERLVTVADQTARFALTANDVQLGDTVKQLDTGVMYIVTDESKLSSADGYTEYTAGAATSVPWSGVTGKPSSYTPASHSHGNIANGGTLGTASRALITDGNKKITTSSVTSTELGYLSGVTSAVQTQLNGKAASSHTHTASEVSGLSTVATSGSYNDLSNKPTIDSALSSTSTNAVQNKVINTALAGKAASSHTHTKSQITDFPTKTSQFTNDSHQTITVGTDTTSTATPAHSGTFTCIDSVTRDSNGHVTAVNTKTVTLPADNNTDTKVTNTLGTTTKAYVTGTTSATTSTGTQIFDTGVYLSTTAGELVATKFTGALNGNANTATQFSANKSVTLTGDVTGTASSKAGWTVATTLSDSGVTAGTYGPSADVTGNNNATISVPEITVDSKGRVTSVANRTLTCKNNTYNVYNKTLTIQKNGTNVATFTSNSNTDVTANITVPTKVSELTNDSGFLTSHQSLSNYVTLNGNQTITEHKTFEKSTDFSSISGTGDYALSFQALSNCIYFNTRGSSNITSYGTVLYAGYLNSTAPERFGRLRLYRTTDKRGETNEGYIVDPNEVLLDISPHYKFIRFLGNVEVSASGTSGTDNYIKPITTNVTDLGTSSNKWSTVYATTFSGALTGDVTGNVTGNCSGSSGSCTGNAATATQFSANTTVALTGDATGTSSGSKKGWSVPVTLANSGVTAGTYGPSADVTGNNNATISVPQITVDAKGRVTSVTNRTLTCKNNTYTVNNKTLTIQKNGTNVATFTSNSSSDVTANITVPTKVSELTNDSGFLTEHQDLSLYPFKMYSTSNGGMFEYIDLADENHIGTGFGGLTTTGIYRVRTTSAVPDAPQTSTIDGNLIVINSGSAANVSSNRRCKQVFICNSRYGTVYHRIGSYSSGTWSWYDWVQEVNTVLDQEISGIKTFKSHLRFSSANTRGTAPSSKEERDLIDYKDSAGNRIFLMDTIYYTDKSSLTSLIAYNTTVATGNNIGGIGIGCDASGNAFTTAITPDASDDSAKIATTAWVNAKGYLTTHQSLENYVTLDTEQAITGTKHTKTTYTDVMPKTETFPGATRYYKSQRDYAYNDETLSLSYGFVQTNGTNVRRWYVYPYSSGDTAYFQIDINADASDSNFKIRAKTVIPASTNETDLGTSSKIWKNIYANNYYLGTTAFGDIVTHNASEFLTSHQSLANYSTLANTVKSLSISGKTITVTPGSGSAYTLTTQDTVYTHPTTAGNKHIPSGGSSGQFLGWDSDGTAKWVNNPNTNTDTLMTQNVSTTNATYPVLLVATADATANQGAKTGIFAKSVKVNPSTNVISASGFSGPLTGNVTGNCSGSSGSCTGLAAKATGDVDGNAIKTTYAKLASPALTGTPTAPTAGIGTNSTQIATTAFVYNNAAKHLSAATNIYVAKTATGNGSGSNTSNYMALADLRTYLATVHMHSSTADLNGSYNLQILFKAGDSFGNATFDAAKIPGVRNLILNTSTGTNSTVDNYSTNSPTFGNITVTGDISVTMRNLNCTGRVSSQFGAYVGIDTYMGIASLQAANYGFLNVAKNMVINVCDAHTDYLFIAANNGILAMWPGATVTINFRQQCYYTRCLFLSSSNGTVWIGYSSFKLTGTEPMAVWGGSGTLTGTSETAAATAEKAVTLASGQTFTLTKNATAKVKFTIDNTAANPTLNIGGTGAKPIYWNNAAVPAAMLMKNITYDVKYNGSQFVIQNAVKRLTNNDFGVFRSTGNYNQTYNSGSWNFTGWNVAYGTGIENSNWRGSHIGNIQQNVTSNNNTFPILFSGTANATDNTSTAPYFGTGVKVNPSTSIISASGFSGLPPATTYVAAVADGGALVNSQTTSFGAVWRAPTKNYQVAGATFPNNNDTVYICYSVTNANVTAGTNTVAKQLTWAADTGTLTANAFSGALTGNVTGNCSGSSGSCTGNSATATQFSANKSVTLTGDVTGTASSKAGWSVATTLANSGVTAGTYGPSADVTGNNNATISVPQITVDAKGRVTSVTNRTLTCKNNTYTVNNATLTIQKNGTNVQTFTANQSSNATANITVPTKTSELTNDSGYLTSHQDLSLYPYKVSAYSSYGNGRWPYRDLGDTTTYPNGFNEIVATGKYQIRFTGSTPNSPYTVTSTASDGILEVDGISSSSSVSSYQRVVQRFYKQNSAHIVYFRAASYHDGQWNWSSSWTVYGDIVTHNASEFLTSHQSLSNYSTLANTVKSLSISGKTITVTPGSGSAYTLTTQDTVYTHPTSAGNKHIPSGGSSGQFLGWNSDGTAKWVNNPNSDTLMTQNVSTTNATYPLLLCPTANATANQGAKTSIFAKSVKINPSTNALSATQLWSNSQTIQNSGFTKGTNPSSQAFWSMYISDKNGNDWATNCLGVFETTCDTSGNVTSVMKAVKNEANSTSAGAIAVTYNKSANTVSTYAPTPATSSNDTNIATTAWVRTYAETTKKFLTAHQSLSNYSTLANTVKSLSISGKTITVTPGSGSAYTLTTQDTVYTHPTTSGNKHIPSGGSSGQFLGWDSDGTAKWVNNPNTNTDTLMTQNVSTTNATYPVLLVATADATANQGAKTGIFAKSVKVNPSTNVISASGFSGPLTGNVTGNCSGSSGSCTGNAATATTAGNVTGTVAIANGGTGATTRLGAVKNLTNENVGTAATYFLGITNSWGKAGYISVADARTVLEIPTFAFQKFAWEKTITLSSMASSSEWEQITGGFKYTANVSLKAGQLTWIYVYLITSNDLIKVVLTNGYILSGKNCVDGGKNSIKADTTTYGNVLTQTVCGSSRLNCLFYPYNSTVTLTMTYTTLAHAGGEDPTLSGKVLIKQ